MKKIFAAMCLLFALGCCATSMAADAAPEGTKPAAKPEDKKKMKKEMPADGSTVTLNGMMAVKATDAKPDVVARLVGRQKMDPVYNLIATGEVAKQIEAMRQEGDKVKIVGVIYGDNVTVNSVQKESYMRK